jgi:hypothetical protein
MRIATKWAMSPESRNIFIFDYLKRKKIFKIPRRKNASLIKIIVVYLLGLGMMIVFYYGGWTRCGLLMR